MCSNSSHFGRFISRDFLFFSVFFVFIKTFSSCFVLGENKLPTVHKITIPHFNEAGYISWELQASKLTQKNDSVFLGIDPILYLFSDRILETTAQSNSGEFLLKKGEARGNDILEVSGNGFNAKGKKWSWRNSSESGENQMIFKEDCEVLFLNGLDDLFANDFNISTSICRSEFQDQNLSQRKEKFIPTIATANYLEFLTIDENTHNFSLDGNVSLDGKNLFLTCDKIDVIFTKDANSSKTPIGEVSMIYATGEVKLCQNGRTSYGDKMTLNIKAGTALLLGSARVVDDEWGVASGEKIILEKGNRMAKVIAGESGKSRLELPPIPNLGFGKKLKKTNLK